MTCAKQTTRATIIALDGRRFVGTNACANPQTTCPRGGMPTGVGYELCQSICRQTGHAEVNACRAAGQEARGGVLYLEGHTYACEPCKTAAEAAGVSVVIGPPPPVGTTPNNSDQAAMLPCPFCGARPAIGPWKDAIDQSDTCPTAIECSSGLDDCPVNPGVCNFSRDDAIAAWNCRAALTLPASEAIPVDALREYVAGLKNVVDTADMMGGARTVLRWKIADELTAIIAATKEAE